jgi:hypothetical protein
MKLPPISTAQAYQSENGLRIRLVAIGRDRSGNLAASYPEVTQLIRAELLGFIWDRFHTYRRQKA